MLQWRASGYTIIEVVIFLAVSGVIFVAAVLLFQGQQGKTQFDQSMRDINSKLEQYVGDVNSGFFPGSDQYSCSAASGGRPVLAGSPNGLGSNTNCIFLGKAISVTPSTNSIKVYTVLGSRLNIDGSGSLASSIGSAAPEPMVQSGFDLSQTYTVLWGATVYSSQITYTPVGSGSQSTVNSNLVGFYNNLSGNQTGGAQSVDGYGYNNTSSAQDKTCIEGTGTVAAGCTNGLLQNWNLCFQSGSSNRRALLLISTSGLGVSTKLTFGGC